MIFLGFKIGQRWLEAVMHSWGSYFVPVPKDRMEISGARWGINGSDSILKLRSVAKSKDWDEYWEFFTTQAKNNTFFPDEYNLMNVQGKMVA